MAGNRDDSAGQSLYVRMHGTDAVDFVVGTGRADRRLTNGGFKKYLASIENAKTLITPPAAELIKLIEAATTARNGIQRARPAHLQAIEASLLGILDSILSGSVAQRRCFDKRIEEIMSTVLECLRRDSQIHVWRLHTQQVSVSELCTALFRKYFHMGPKRYSKIRQLNWCVPRFDKIILAR